MTNSIIHYSIDEVKRLSNRELLEHIRELNMPVRSMSKFIKNGHHIPVLDELISRTNFLDSTSRVFVPILARLYCIEHDITEHPRCQNPNCPNVVEWRNGLHRFAPYCSMKCRDSDPEFQTRKRQGMFLKHGVYNCMELDWVKDKAKQTTKERFGVEHATQSKVIQEKTKRTNEERYGVSYVFQSEEFRKKSEATCEAKYGVKHPCQNPNILERQKQTFIENYGTHPMKTKEGVEKVKQTMMERHGVECAFQLDYVKERLRESNISKYGVMWYMQSPEYHKKRKHKYTSQKYPDLTFDSTWEVKVYEFCRDSNIPIEYSPKISYEYEYDGRIWTYHPDFLINGKVYEVKGDNFFRTNESGQEEMFCPYRDEDWSDEKYNWMCSKFEAKHQCMLYHHIIILRNKHIDNLSKELFQ